jgi:thiamine pyrophosphate-dependent acetolactate synthase large subunit-like protein
MSDASRWGSDVVADVLRATGVPYIALNPGASFRGLHDSLVNHLGDTDPHMLLCLHEEHAVALAHGYAKVTGRPLAVALHSNVGLMHASMALYNAWCDRVPMLVVGAAGPFDATKRRPWIDWIHTSADQAALVRPFVKWDDQPTSVGATVAALAQAWEVTRTPPCAPTYVVLDAAVQEEEVTVPAALPPLRTGNVEVPHASPDAIERAVELLSGARYPVLLAGRCSRDIEDWTRRVTLAERLGARVVTDLKAGAAFPTTHPFHVPGPAFFLSADGREALAEADVVLALDWIDVAGTLAQAPAAAPRLLVTASLDAQLHRGWTKDGQAHVLAEVALPTTPDVAVAQLLAALGEGGTAREPVTPVPSPRAAAGGGGGGEGLLLADLAGELRATLAGVDTCLVRLPLGWDGDAWPFEHPLDYLGYDGGGGIGSGPGMLVGAALGLRDTGRLPVAVLGDGDYLMGVQALWTAAHDGIPLLAVVANNRSYFNDEVHQEKVATTRDRDVSRKWVGQRIDDPAPDLAALARAQGLDGIGPVTDLDALREALPRARDAALSGRPVVVDVVVRTGYSPAMASGLTRDH